MNFSYMLWVMFICCNIFYNIFFFRNNNDYDIALILTKTDIVFSDRVGPACLPFKFTGTNLVGSVVTALG